MPRISFRLVLSLVYLAALFAAAGYLYQWMQHFDGYVYVARGKTESVAVRLSGEGFSLAPMQRNMPAELVLFDTPNESRRQLNSRKHYDAAQMPFRLRLDGIEVLEERPMREVLQVVSGGERPKYPIAPGASVALGEGAVEVVAIRPWAGLVRHGNGQPMAVFSLQGPDGTWRERVFVNTKNWQYPIPGVAVRLRWFKSRKEAKDALPQKLPGVTEARWGLADRGTVNWFQGFLPGTGATLSDGTEATLLRYAENYEKKEAEGPAILVHLRKGEQEEKRWVCANEEDQGGPIRFEYPTLRDTIIYLHAWRDGAALMVAFHDEKRHDSVLLEEAAVHPAPEGFPYAFRLDQTMATALPVEAAGAPVFEVVLKTPQGELCLREGQSTAVGESRLVYRRLPTPPLVRYSLASLPLDGGKPSPFRLGPGDSARRGTWRFSQTPDHIGAANGAFLRAERTLGSFSRNIAALLIVLGSVGLVVARFRKDRPR